MGCQSCTLNLGRRVPYSNRCRRDHHAEEDPQVVMPRFNFDLPPKDAEPDTRVHYLAPGRRFGKRLSRAEIDRARRRD